MTVTVERVDVRAALTDLHRSLDVLFEVDLDLLSDEESVAVVRDFERFRRRLEAADHYVLGDLDRRGVAVRAGMRSTSYWLRQALQVDIHEANARVRAARLTGPRRSLIGEPLPASYPVVAAAQVAGDLGVKQARVITTMLERLPAAVCEHVPDVEARLVGFAAQLDAQALQHCADRERDFLDPDGGYRDVERRRRDRDFRVTQRPDGSCTGSFQGTAELGEFLQVAFDALAAPEPEHNGVKDPRTPGQRRHDALLDALKIAVGSGSLPSTGGVLATVVLTMTAEAYATGTGFALTGHNALVPVLEALRWAGGDYRLMITALNSLKAVVAYSSTHRLLTEGQRLALIARDGGCCFPGCLAPPGWCQSHHVTEWQDSKRTSVDDAALLCGWHHREFERLGWSVKIIDGWPVWTPPRMVDPEQRPIRT